MPKERPITTLALGEEGGSGENEPMKSSKSLGEEEKNVDLGGHARVAHPFGQF
jgi:hypothetical protein